MSASEKIIIQKKIEILHEYTNLKIYSWNGGEYLNS